MLAVIPILLAFVVLFLGIFIVLLIYLWLLWYASNSSIDKAKSTMEEIKGTGCVICLDEIEVDQLIRLLPICNHGFHLEWADSWLSKNSVCPICRTKLQLHSLVDVDYSLSVSSVEPLC
ncbi:hypothetical protein MKX01_038708 [Papaver californicum]|nr:hypothetical protein MKX01_038708 [Papaver californicum]